MPTSALIAPNAKLEVQNGNGGTTSYIIESIHDGTHKSGQFVTEVMVALDKVVPVAHDIFYTAYQARSLDDNDNLLVEVFHSDSYQVAFDMLDRPSNLGTTLAQEGQMLRLRNIGTIPGRLDNHRCYIWETRPLVPDDIGYRIDSIPGSDAQLISEIFRNGGMLRLESEEFYRLERILSAQGHFSVVFLGRQMTTDRQVAVKLQRNEHNEHEEQTLRTLATHLHLPGLIDGGPIKDVIINNYTPPAPGHGDDMRDISRRFIGALITEYIEGEALANHKILAEETIVTILRQICRGVAHIHRKNYVHGDLKPDNILLARPDGRVKILDLGAAFQPGASKEINIGGTAYGSFEAREYVWLSDELAAIAERITYESEQLAEDELHALAAEYDEKDEKRNSVIDLIDQRTDIFSIGCLIYRLSTGHEPRHYLNEVGEPDGIILTIPPDSPFKEIIEIATARHPADRFKDASDLLSTIEKRWPGYSPIL